MAPSPDIDLTREVVAEFEHGTVYGGCDGEAWRYGTKHRSRFGRFLRERAATAADPLDPYRITYSFKPSSPARQRFEARMREKAERKAQQQAERKAQRQAEREARRKEHNDAR